MSLYERGFNLTLGLNRRIPLAVGLANGDTLNLAQYGATVSVTNPAQFRQRQAAVFLFNFETLRKSETVVLPASLELWKVGSFGKEVAVTGFKVFEGLLQRLTGRFFEPCGRWV